MHKSPFDAAISEHVWQAGNAVLEAGNRRRSAMPVAPVNKARPATF